MNSETLHRMRGDAQERREFLIDYFRRCRAVAIGKYRAATLWVQRKDARAWALHYGRLARNMERRYGK